MARFYVGNIPWKATEDEISECFKQFGEVTDVNIIKDKETGNSKGFCFIDIETESDASAMAGLELGGRALKVDVARERKPKAQA